MVDQKRKKTEDTSINDYDEFYCEICKDAYFAPRQFRIEHMEAHKNPKKKYVPR